VEPSKATAYGGMDTDAVKELKELRAQNSRLKRLLAEAELEMEALREVVTEGRIKVAGMLVPQLPKVENHAAGRDR
jgi:hypothetical protein